MCGKFAPHNWILSTAHCTPAQCTLCFHTFQSNSSSVCLVYIAPHIAFRTLRSMFFLPQSTTMCGVCVHCIAMYNSTFFYLRASIKYTRIIVAKSLVTSIECNFSMTIFIDHSLNFIIRSSIFYDGINNF